MDVRLATHSGHPERGNEDFVGAVPGAVVLLDGAGIPGTEAICHHGVGWYTHRLGGTLLDRLSRQDGRDLAALLADAIDEVATAHRDTCDLAHPSSPQATVAIVRVTEDRLEHLLLADSTLLVGRSGPDPEVLAKDDPAVAAEAVTGAVPLDDVVDLALLSNGVTRLVDRYALLTWPDLLALTRTSGPDAVLRLLRAHEPDESARDDATVAYVSSLVMG